MSELVPRLTHTINEIVGEDDGGEAITERADSIEYEFSDSVSQDAREEVREKQPKTKREAVEIINSIDGQ